MGEPEQGPRGTGNQREDRRKPRRASLPAPEGSDPEPYDPPAEKRPESENDARLRTDRPPHWG